MPSSPIKRPNYFTSQFLVATDFQAEQVYHRNLRQHHHLALHSWGVLGEGWQITETANTQRVLTVSPGVAVDSQGRTLVLGTAKDDVSVVGGNNATVYLSVRYSDVRLDADRYRGPGDIDEHIRITETPEFVFTTDRPEDDSNQILLAQIRLGADSTVANIDPSVRRYATAWIAPGATLKGPLTIQDALSLAGSLTVGNAVEGRIEAADVLAHKRVEANTLVSKQSLAIGNAEPNASIPFLLRTGSSAVGITQGRLGGSSAMELTTADESREQATRVLMRGRINNANVEFYRGGRGAETLSMVINGDNGDVGIGTTLTPSARLQVSGGAIMPAAGDSDNAGILFPPNAFGGGGDSAWMRYYARSGENATLELGTSNDSADHIALMPSGNVGIGINDPTAKLHINGGSLRFGSDNHGIDFFGGARVYKKSGSGLKLQPHSDTHGIEFVKADGSTSQMYIKDGNVGIGTNAPGTALQVDGTTTTQSLDIRQSSANPTTVKIHSVLANNSSGFSASRLEFWNNPVGSDTEWRPGYIASTDNAVAKNMPFVGGLAFYVNGTGANNRQGSVETMRLVNGRVGIGTTNPDSRLDIAATSGNVLSAGASTSSTANIDLAGHVQLREHGRTGTAFLQARDDRSTRNISLLFRTQRSTNGGNTRQLVDAMFISQFGDTGIGTNNPTSKLHVQGGVFVSGGVSAITFTERSDQRKKKNIETVTNPLDKVLQLRGVKFDWKESFPDTTASMNNKLGVIAQEVEAVFPNLIHHDAEGYKSVEYSGLIAVLIEAIKELKTDHDYLKQQLQAAQ